MLHMMLEGSIIYRAVELEVQYVYVGARYVAARPRIQRLLAERSAVVQVRFHFWKGPPRDNEHPCLHRWV
jgi:hypothetical protein